MKNNIKKIIATVFTMTFIVIAVVTVTSCNKKSNITRTEETTNAPSKENTTEYRTEENTTENKTENNSEVTSTENVTTENNIQETQSTTEENTTQVVTQAPTQKPTQTPTQRPTQQPTTQAPTQAPTQKPTEAPTQAPTQAPTEAPTEAPINVPWYRPYLSNGRPDYRNWRTGEGYDSKEERAKNNKIMTDDFLNNFAPSFNFDSNTYVYNNGVLSIKMFYVYMHTPYGTELIGKSEDHNKAREIKEKQDAKWKPGYMWSTCITTKELKEVSYFD